MNSAQLAEWLVTVADLDEARQLMAQHAAHIDRGLFQTLKDQIASAMRVDINRAVHLAEITRLAAEATDDPVCQALSAHAHAMALDRSGRHAEALEFYNRAEAIYQTLGQEVEAARLARAKMSSFIYMGQYVEALQVASRARQVLEQHSQLALVAQVDSNVGSIYHRLDQYHNALEFYQRAKDLFASLHDDLGLAIVDEHLANVYSCLNDFDRALTLYQSARRTFEAMDRDLQTIQVDYNLAWLLFLRGKFDEALAHFHRVKAASGQRGDRIQTALCDMDLAEMYLQLNAYDDALESAALAREQFAGLNMNYEQAKARLFGGLAHWQLNHVEHAEVELGEARRLFLQEGNQIYLALCDLYLSDLERQRQDFDVALALCEEAHKIFSESQAVAKAAYAQLKMAQLHAEQGRTKQAERLCNRALKTINGLEAPWLKYQCYHLKGKLSANSGKTAHAYEGYATAINHIEHMRSQIRVDEFKSTFLKDKLKVYEDMVELCLSSASEEKLREAFAYVEAAKSRTLVDLLSSTITLRAKSAQPADQQIYERWGQLREELDWYYNKLNQNDLTGGQRAAEIGVALRQEIQTREMELTRLLRQIQLQGDAPSSPSTAPLPSALDASKHLAENEALVEYYMVGEQIHVFVLDANGLRVIKHISSTEKALRPLRKLRFQLNKHIFGEYVGRHTQSLMIGVNEHLEALYQELIDPVRQEIKGKDLVIIPHEFLHYVPFHALYDGREYLIDRHEVSYCPSASTFKLCAERPLDRRANGRRALIVGVPDEAAPLIQQEVETVQASMPESDVLLGATATLENFKRQATRCQLVHLACHATFRQDNPLFSSLKLADSWLNFYDIFNLDLNAELVTLSACQTGLSKVFAGDELVGLMRGFLYAGVPSLIVSLWAVNDRSSSEFMKLLYRRLTDGGRKRAALREAQLALKEAYPNPYYWAPFVLMGKP